MAGFSDPVSALNAIVACLNMPPNVVVHTGSLGSGETIPCCIQPCDGDGCEGALLRVETGPTRPAPKEGTIQYPPMIITGKCAAPLIQEVVINYRVCFPSNTGKQATPTATLTAVGVSIVMSWWDALQRIWACDSGIQQRFRFVSRDDSIPAGQCAGWTLTLEHDLGWCRTIESTTPDHIVGIGMAGESNTPI